MDHNKRLKPSSNRFCLQKTARGSHLDSGDQYKLVWFCASEFFFFLPDRCFLINSELRMYIYKGNHLIALI